jgi:hypothetical protein
VVYGASHRAGQLGETGPPRPFTYQREDAKASVFYASTALITTLGSWGKAVPCGHLGVRMRRRPSRVSYGANHRVGQLVESSLLQPLSKI